MSNLPSYQKIKQSYHKEVADIFDGHIDVTEKIDGCVSYKTKISLANGKWEQIGKIVNDKLPLEVLTYNKETEMLEPKKITNWFKNGNSTDWLTIASKGRIISLETKMIVTPNHAVYVKSNGEIIKKQAGDLKVGDIVLKPNYRIDPVQKQLLYGCLLGDSSLGTTSGSFKYTFGHSVKQNEYLKLKHNLLKNLCSDIAKYTSGYGSDMLRFFVHSIPFLREMDEKCRVDGKKKITDEWIKELGIIALAFWYMDDGSCTFSDRQRGRLHFATNCFSDEECNKLVTYFKNMGYDSSIHDAKGNTLVFSADSTERFFREISFFVPKQMQYKIPESCRLETTFWDVFDYSKIGGMTLMESEITSIEKTNESLVKYDIEVEDNHNYFANRMLVSNSQFRTIITPDGEIRCGSHHVEFTSHVEGSFQTAVDNAKEIFKDYKPPNTITLFFEYLSKPKQNTIFYERVPKNNIILFDMMLNDKYVNRKCTEEFAKKFDLEIVPLLWSGDGKNFTDDVYHELLEHKSILGHDKKGYQKIEGIVIKNYLKYYNVSEFPYLEGMWMACKIVNEDFKEKNKITNKSNNLDTIKQSLISPNRWQKAYQYLEEKGELKHEMGDMAKLAPRVKEDIRDEEKEEIKEQLWKLFGPNIMAASLRGLAEWYGRKLAEE